MRSALQGQLYKLHDPSTYGSGSPLGKKVRRPSKASLVKEKISRKLDNEEEDVTGLPALPVRYCQEEPPLLGYSFQDWHHRLCEVCPNVAEFRYASKSQLDPKDPSMSRHAPRMKRVGYIQASTEIMSGDKVSLRLAPSESLSSWSATGFEWSLSVCQVEIQDFSTGEKLGLWTFEITFYNLESAFVGKRTYVFGHPQVTEVTPCLFDG